MPKKLTRRWPNVPKFNDVRECGKHNLEPVDIIAGGFPCQDVSVAGLRAGIEGQRSGLWQHFRRIIGELRPRYALVENVPGLLSDGMGRVLGDLAEIRYDAEWDCIPVCAFGASHIHGNECSLLPTPQAIDAKGTCAKLSHKRLTTYHLKHWVHGTILAIHSRTLKSSWAHPEIVGYLMGFPPHWLSDQPYEDTETL